MLLLNEKEYVLNMLQNNEKDFSQIYTFLYLYARYLHQEEHLQKNRIIQKLDEFMQTNYPRYNPIDWNSSIEKYAKKADKYPLCECSGVWITENELQTIEEIQNKVLERLAFTLLCLAKFNNFRNPMNNNWLNYSNGEIYTFACINTTALDKDRKLSLLKQLGLIEFAKKINNLNIRVLFIKEESKPKLFISDFRKLGYEWRLYKGEKYIRCTSCGILAKNTNGKRKYCVDCANRNKKKLDQLRMEQLRKSRIC